jgi:hypothetical protein
MISVIWAIGQRFGEAAEYRPALETVGRSAWLKSAALDARYTAFFTFLAEISCSALD